MLIVPTGLLAGSPKGSTYCTTKVATMTETDVALDRVEFDLILMRSAVAEGDDQHRRHDDGGEVTFTVKELLVDLRAAVEEVGRSTKADVAAAESRLADRIGPLEGKVDSLRLDRAKIVGICVGAAMASGGLAGVIARAFT